MSPISSANMKFKYSTKVGAAGNANAGTAAGSLGKYISTTEIVDATAANLWDDISGAENLAGEAEYRCVFVHNADGALTLQNAGVYLSAETAGGASIAIGVDPTAASAIGAAPAQALSVVDENTAPAGVAFSSPTTQAAAIALGDIPPGQCRAFWIRRTANNTAAQADSVTYRLVGDSL